jgi:hypothetical protein
MPKLAKIKLMLVGDHQGITAIVQNLKDLSFNRKAILELTM